MQTNKSGYDNMSQFQNALKAAAWDAQTMFRRGDSGDRTQCVRQAGQNLGLLADGKFDNVDEQVIRDAIFVLAFREPDMPRVDLVITQSWSEYAGMGAKARSQLGSYRGIDPWRLGDVIASVGASSCSGNACN
jgi:hypothetical protein